MGGSVATHNNFWQLFVRPAGQPAAGSWSPRPGSPTTAAWSWPAPAGVADHRVPAQPVPDLHAADRHPRRRPGLGIDRPAGRGPGRRPRRPGRRARTGHLLALLTDGTAELAAPGYTSWTTLATQRVPRRDARRPPLRPAEPHRRHVHPAGHAAARRQLQPPGNRRHLRRHRRHLARGRARAARRPGRPAHPGAQADQYHSSTVALLDGGHRASRQPARRLVHRQRQPLGPLAPAPR